ncbi:LysE family translocator [Dechloromonas sp. ZS-1]|uniref:LysE family translocator n=1 Tax=Dechloromonas sp. ZS-1 TaxID=3138067 RepID=UPI0031FDC33D
MITLPDLLVFVAALTAVYLLPGPDMALVLSTSAFRGPRSGLMAAVGLAISRTVHVALSALGLAALFHTHPVLFDVVRWFGAAYLLFLAWKMLQVEKTEGFASANTTGKGLEAIRSGVMTNLLNPKALMFCALLLPQFISTEHDLTAQYLTLGAILVGLGFAFDALYALTASRLAKRFSGSGTMQKATKLMFSTIFGFAAIRLAIGGN